MHCKACSHPRRNEIDRQLVAGVGYRNIAASFELSLGSLSRHRSHIEAALADAMNQRASERSEQSHDILNRVERLVGESEELLATAKAAGNIKDATGCIAAATRLLDLLGRLTGGLNATGGLNIHLTSNRVTVNNNYAGDDRELALAVSEATDSFNPDTIERLKALIENRSDTALICNDAATPL